MREGKRIPGSPPANAAKGAPAVEARRRSAGPVTPPWAFPDVSVHDPGMRSGDAPAGAPLPGAVAAYMERAFAADFRHVRIGEGTLREGVVAATRGDQVRFRVGMPRPDDPLARPLLAHELAHVVQQRRRGESPPGPAVENEASRAAVEVTRGGRADPREPVSAATFLHSQLSDMLDAEWAARRDKGKIFDLLRASTTKGDADARTSLQSMFAAGTDDLWLALTLLDNGPEPLWSTALVAERVRRAAAGKWAAEAGDIEADLPDPYGTSPKPRVRAFFFPGVTARRALIIGGIHGNEQQAADTVEMLRVALRTRSLAGTPPYFTTILVPTLFEQTHKEGPKHSAGKRHVPGGMGRTVTGRLQESRSVEPNRNFPLPGEDLAAAEKRGKAKPTDPELVFRDKTGTVRAPQDTPDVKSGERLIRRGQTGTSIRMLAETRILIGLIERFQPERLASVHAHSLKTIVGDAPGIFVDPRGIDPATGKVSDQKQVDEDDRLASAMVAQGTKRWGARGVAVPGAPGRTADPFVGNAPGTPGASVRYSSPDTPEGNSLGTWAPVPTVAGTGGAAVSRAGITTVTVEIPQWTAPRQAGALQAIKELHRDLLLEIFLGDPGTVTPAAPAPVRPTP